MDQGRLRKGEGDVVLPRNEDNSAFLAVLPGDEIKIIHSIAALISRKTGSKVIIALGWPPNLLHYDLLLLLLNLENDEAEFPFGFQLEEPRLAVIVYSHSRCSISLQKQ